MKKRTMVVFVTVVLISLFTAFKQIHAQTIVEMNKDVILHMKKAEVLDLSFKIEKNNVLQAYNISNLEIQNSNQDVVQLTNNQLVALNYGTSIFRARDRSGNTLRITVHVFDSVVVKNTSVQLDIGEPVTLNVGTQPEANLVGFRPTFFSNNTIIADVNSDGVVIGKSIGVTTITVDFLGVKTAISVEVIDRPDFRFINNTLDINVDASTSLQYELSLFNNEDKRIEWRSSNPKIVTVDSRGGIFGVKEGSADIIARVNNFDYILKVTVISSILDLRITNPTMSLNVNEKKEINYQVIPSAYQETPVIWESTKPSVATINNGVVHAISAGETTIIARINNIVKELKVTVNIPLDGIVLTPRTQTIKQGQRVTLQLNSLPSNATEILAPIYSSSNNEVATVDAFGNVTGIAPGRAIIFVQHKNYNASSTIDVEFYENEEGLKTISGTLRNSYVIFDTRGIQNLEEFILQIPYYPLLFNSINPKVNVILNEVGSLEKLLVNRIELSPEYSGKSFELEFIDSQEKPIVTYQFKSYLASQNNSIFPQFSYIESPFTNLKSNMYELELPVFLSASDKLTIYLDQNVFNNPLKVYVEQFRGRVTLYSTNVIEVSDNSVITVDSLEVGKYYLNDQNPESPLLIITLVLLGVTLLFVLSIVVNKVTNFLRKNEIETRIDNDSINYSQQKNKKETE
ncbi:MAG: hypothetical protein GXY98_06805 [Erysipelothrix sp.]|nr:hypothetical protein [Erysipelothrix sp.]